jgi:NTE family protein
MDAGSQDGPNGWLRDALKRARAIARRGALPRPAPRARLGLALAGGFARGIAHIGVLKVLAEHQVSVDYVAGTSVGALIATLYAHGVPLDAMERLAVDTRFKDFGRWTISWLGLASNSRLETYLGRLCSARRFEELRIPLAIAATDLGTGAPVYFTEGELGPALRASCAYPGMFLPVQYGGRTLVDGFVSAPVPVDGVRQLGADVVIAVYLESGPPDGQPKSVGEVIGRSFSIMQTYAHRVWAEKADVVITPDVTRFGWDDFARTPELITAGEVAARAALPALGATLAPTPAQPSRARNGRIRPRLPAAGALPALDAREPQAQGTAGA